MIDVFVSYCRADTPSAERLVDELKARSLLVWWDRELPAGAVFPVLIEKMINASRITVVLWSAASKESTFVTSEAYIARTAGNYAGLILENGCVPTAPFNIIQAYDLDKAEFETAKLDAVVSTIAQRANAHAASGHGTAGTSEDARAWIAAMREGTPEAFEGYLAKTNRQGQFSEAATAILDGNYPSRSGALPAGSLVIKPTALAAAAGSFAAGIALARSTRPPNAARRPGLGLPSTTTVHGLDADDAADDQEDEDDPELDENTPDQGAAAELDSGQDSDDAEAPDSDDSTTWGSGDD